MGIKFPTPLEDSDHQIPSSPGRQRCQMPGVCPGGGMLKLRFDRYIRLTSNTVITHAPIMAKLQNTWSPKCSPTTPATTLNGSVNSKRAYPPGHYRTEEILKYRKDIGIMLDEMKYGMAWVQNLVKFIRRTTPTAVVVHLCIELISNSPTMGLWTMVAVIYQA